MKFIAMLFGSSVWFVVGLIVGCFAMHYADVSAKPDPAELRGAAPEITFYGKDSAEVSFLAVVRGHYMRCRIWVAPTRRAVSTMC